MSEDERKRLCDNLQWVLTCLKLGLDKKDLDPVIVREVEEKWLDLLLEEGAL